MDPLQLQTAHILFVDLIEGAVAIASGNSVVGRPLSLFRVSDGLNRFARDGFCFGVQWSGSVACQTAEVCHQIPPLVRSCLQWRHVRLLFASDFLIVGVRQQVHTAVECLQLQIVFRLIAGKPSQRGTVSQAHVHHSPCDVGTEGPTRTTRRRVHSHLCGWILQHQFNLAHSCLQADIGKVRAIGFSSAVNHVARRTIAAAEEELPAGAGISSRPVAVRGGIERMHPGRELLKLVFGQRKRRHPTSCSGPDQILNLFCATAPQPAIVDERRCAIASFSTLAMAAFTELLELFFGRGQAGFLARGQSGSRNGQRGTNRPFLHCASPSTVRKERIRREGGQ